jgi:hypothetical protein
VLDRLLTLCAARQAGENRLQRSGLSNEHPLQLPQIPISRFADGLVHCRYDRCNVHISAEEVVLKGVNDIRSDSARVNRCTLGFPQFNRQDCT